LFVTHNTAEALLLGSRLLVLKPHCEGSDESNVLLDMPLPQSGGTIAEREQSREFIELREYVKHMAYGSSPRQTAMEQETDESGDSV
jgi:ABC-type nitrate/sulfonate/bicarbonate transport system ATPase subunit